MQLRTKRIKVNKVSNKLEKFLTFYFFILIIISSIFNLLRNNTYYDVWTIGEWLINYQGGFVRRGLFGSIIYKLSYIFNINPIAIIHISTLLFFVLFLYLLKDSKKYFSTLFLLSPIVSLAPLLGNYLVRKDISGIVAYAICTILITKKNKFPNFTLINLISCLSILNHESYVFYSVPSLVLLHFASSQNTLGSKNNFLKMFKAIIFILPCLLVSLIVFYFKGNYEIAFRINESWLNLATIIPLKEFPHSFNPSGAIGSLAWTLDQGISLPLSTITSFKGGGWIWIPAIWMLTIFICGQIFIGDKNKFNAKLKVSVLLLQFTFISPLFLLGWDFGRWIFLWISSSIFFTVALIKIRRLSKKNLVDLEKICPNYLIKLFNGYELNGFKKYLYLLLSIPGCCWSINNYFKILPIIYPFNIFQN